MSSSGEMRGSPLGTRKGVVLRGTVGARRVVCEDAAVIAAPSPAALSLALAHAIEERLEDGRLLSAAEVARRIGVTRARLSQILRLLDLAPDIQERVLLGTVAIRARALRPLVREVAWSAQRAHG